MDDKVKIPDGFYQTFYEFWRKVRCPRCEATNWIYDSHSERNYPDIRDGVKCYQCFFLFWLGEPEEFLARYAGELEDHTFEEVMEGWFSYQNGRPSP